MHKFNDYQSVCRLICFANKGGEKQGHEMSEHDITVLYDLFKFRVGFLVLIECLKGKISHR